MQMTVTISCAADSELAAKLYDHLLRTLSIDTNEHLVREEDEIYIDSEKLGIGRETLLKRIDEFIRTNLPEYQLTDLDDIVTIGLPASSGEMMGNLLVCEMCSYATPYEEQLHLHKMTHGNVMIG